MKKKHGFVKKAITRLRFHLKRFGYRVFSGITERKDTLPLWAVVFKQVFLQTAKCVVIAFIVWIIERVVVHFYSIGDIDKTLFLDAIIGSTGIAGVILGLYCTNISTIYSAQYFAAPEVVSKSFQNDRLTQKGIGTLLSYIIFGLIIVTQVLFGVRVGWITVVVMVVWSVVVIVSYSLVGKRPYQLSNVYAVADDAYATLCSIVQERLQSRLFSSDQDYQFSFFKQAQKSLGVLEEIQTYGIRRDTNGGATLCEFMCKNIALISAYWAIKPTIGNDSLWYRKDEKYQRWHRSSHTEAHIALATGTQLNRKQEKNYWWFENTLIQLNQTGLKELIKRSDYVAIYKYIYALGQLTKEAVRSNELGHLVEIINEVCGYIESEVLKKKGDELDSTLAGIVDVLAYIYLGLLLDVKEYCNKYNVDDKSNKIIRAINAGKPVEKTVVLRGSENAIFYKKLMTEKKIEGKRVTPDWIVKQAIAYEDYNAINRMIRYTLDGVNTIFTLGKRFVDEGHFLEACIVLSRFFEYESKYMNARESINKCQEKLQSLHVELEYKWDASNLSMLNDSMSKWKHDIPLMLTRCAGGFTAAHWNKTEDYPDFIGECYNHICEDAISAIESNDFDQFCTDFSCLTNMMLLYQEYIRTDFLDKDKLYRKEYVYYQVTSPIAEWAQIGGLAILWGEFRGTNQWTEKIKGEVAQFLSKMNSEGEIVLAEKLVEYARNREMFMYGFMDRGIIETNWNIRIVNAVKESGLCDTAYSFYGMQLKTESIILKAFCTNFIDFGFTSNPAEVFWVLCVNPLLAEDKKYHSGSAWEKKLHD